ncbi:rab family GTPase [Selaginella moellendorffii]|uniref:Ras-related protein Rab-21 n=1 Tax=Selaginella moellendorffii TaxID=88036 RepID=D8QUM7_SELML|nr:ras-related protein Rab-21 isoform X2 [Selaginella moellendorffii]XP_024518985.1 ras-related protein Rab-21 isoform X2 [Selaginella moellendorffii]EFJ35899.1 rab family GTPase [Selaginella moellendorffii]|eukprot:XP_024518984.1 ras-related protein Rab-21 isoform X2 [Selaginella moellendorffii]
MRPGGGGGSPFKVVLLGDGRVGKTSLVLRYVNNQFSDSQSATIQASYLTKRLSVDGAVATLSIWDTAGQERFHALGPIYYRDADGALLVYDIMDRDSFTRVKNWVKELRKMASNKNIVLTIAGNKSDMDKLRQVDLQDSERYAASIGANHFVTSAKLNTGIDEAFMDIATRCLEQRRKSTAASSNGSTPAFSQRKSVVIVDDQPPPPPPSRCCS